jgi:hypothetical protein
VARVALLAAGWVALLAPAGAAPHALAATALAAALGLLLVRLLHGTPAVVPVATSGRVGPTVVPRCTPRAFAPGTAGRPRPRAPGRTATPSG